MRLSYDEKHSLKIAQFSSFGCITNIVILRIECSEGTKEQVISQFFRRVEYGRANGVVTLSNAGFNDGS